MKKVPFSLIFILLVGCSTSNKEPQYPPLITSTSTYEVIEQPPVNEPTYLEQQKTQYPEYYSLVKDGSNVIPKNYSDNISKQFQDYYHQSVTSINGNQFFETDDNVYFGTYSEYSGIFAWNKKSNKIKVLYEGVTKQVAVYKDRLYFMNLENTIKTGGYDLTQEWALCSIDLDGQDFRYEIPEVAGSSFYLHGNLLFLTVGNLIEGIYKSENSRLAYLNLDNNQFIISDLNVAPVSFAFYNRKLYFIEEADTQIKSYNLDSKEVKEYGIGTLTYLYFYKQKIYFNLDGKLMYLDVTTDSIESVGNIKVPNARQLLITDDYVFFDFFENDVKKWAAFLISTNEVYEFPNLKTENDAYYQIINGKMFTYFYGITAVDFNGNSVEIASKEDLISLIQNSSQ